jgi:hypothetical protein
VSGSEAQDIKYHLQKIGFEIPEIVNSGEKAIEKAQDLKPDII